MFPLRLSTYLLPISSPTKIHPDSSTHPVIIIIVIIIIIIIIMNYFLSANLKYTSELDALYKKTKKRHLDWDR